MKKGATGNFSDRENKNKEVERVEIIEELSLDFAAFYCKCLRGKLTHQQKLNIFNSMNLIMIYFFFLYKQEQLP